MYMEPSKFMTAKPFAFDKEVDYSDGGIISIQVMAKPTGNITLFSFDKGQMLSEHTSPFDAMLQVVEGKAEVTIGGNSNTLTQGMTIIMPANITHAVIATEKFKMVLTMIKQ